MQKENIKMTHVRWTLVLCDLIIWALVSGVLLVLHPSQEENLGGINNELIWMGIGVLCVFIPRFLAGVYTMIWRYGYIGAYMRQLISDTVAAVLYVACTRLVPIEKPRAVLAALIILADLVFALATRAIYYYAYKAAAENTRWGSFLRGLLRIFGVNVKKAVLSDDERIKRVAILGAGRVGTGLAEDLINNPKSGLKPVCFIESDHSKVGRTISGLPVLYENTVTGRSLAAHGIDELIIAIPESSSNNKKNIYEKFKDSGLDIRVFDYPTVEELGAETKRKIREVTIEEILGRTPVKLDSEELEKYYKGKTVLVTGGGGSIGSELCRQIAVYEPEKLIILDIAENTTYDLQQELIAQHGEALNLAIEICDIRDENALEQVFAAYRPNIVLHAAAHKHVPLMEHNGAECIKNNVTGTLNTARLSRKYGVERFIMISTDKAVNPTNIMGASKRICEMIVLAMSQDDSYSTIFSATRFGNVLGSAGSVVPLFKKQIEAGGPVTLTHKDIIRYFMTIPEASQLVLTSGALAKNGELFVLDMGQPVKIYELAENMIKLTGQTPGEDIKIIETGLRPGEKLFEELLINGENQEKTQNELIFVEKDEPLTMEDMQARVDKLLAAAESEDTEKVKEVLREIVPTYRG